MIENEVAVAVLGDGILPVLDIPALGDGILSILDTPVLQTGADGFDSVTEELVRSLNQHLLYIAVPITLLVEAILVYTVYRFRASDEPKPTAENRRLEITWTVATAFVLLFVGVASYQVLVHTAVNASPQATGDDLPDDAVDVTITGQQFLWSFEYPDANVSSTDALVLPTNRTVVLRITSADVVHSVHVPDLGLKQDAIPGRYTYLTTVIEDEGTYTLYCAEYCGSGHSDMLADVEVVSPAAYEEWLEEQRAEATTDEASGDREAVSRSR